MTARDEYIKFFEDADKDNSGSLTLDELTLALRARGYNKSDHQIREMFQSVDTSGDGLITLDEYLVAMGEQPAQVHGIAAMRRVFLDFDKDGNGRIDKNELKKSFAEMGRYFSEDELSRMMAQMDDDKSGDIDYEEFMRHIFNVEIAK